MRFSKSEAGKGDQNRTSDFRAYWDRFPDLKKENDEDEDGD